MILSEQQETVAGSSGKMKAPKRGGTKKSKKREMNDKEKPEKEGAATRESERSLGK